MASIPLLDIKGVEFDIESLNCKIILRQLFSECVNTFCAASLPLWIEFIDLFLFECNLESNDFHWKIDLH